MFDQEKTEQILNGIVWLNEKMGVWSFLVPIVFAVIALWALVRSYLRPSSGNSRIVLAVYAVIYIFGGFTNFVGKDFMGSRMALGGAVGLWAVSAFLVLDIVFGWTEVGIAKEKHLQIVSWILILSGIFLYPVLEILLGFTYPRMVFFGAECPTTISLIGRACPMPANA